MLCRWENIIIQVDANIHQHEIEKQEEMGKKTTKPSPLKAPSTTTPFVTTDIVPMEIDAVYASWGKLTEAKQDYCIQNKLCLYCGKPRHIVTDCYAWKAKHGDSSQQGKVKLEEK